MADVRWVLDLDIEKQGIEKVKQQLEQIKKEAAANSVSFNTDPASYQEALRRIDILKNAIEKAYNPNLNYFDNKKFISTLNNAKLSAQQLNESFKYLGLDSSKALSEIQDKVEYTGLSIKKTNKLAESMGTTFKNTLKWNIASQSIYGVERAIGSAIQFIRDLDESLNNIRVVTGDSADQMKIFAQQANEAARALGKTTTEYTDASLIFFQQGKSASDVRKLTEATLIGANITGESVKDTSELLTAALNGFNLQADKAMDIMDKFAAVGATTGSDFNELAIGFSKVASMAKSAGVNVDQLNAMLATTSTVTREAPESIGTSFKTIFGRMDTLNTGGKDEEGWTMGKAEKALNNIGISLLDDNKKLRDLGQVITEVGDKWSTLGREDQMGVSTALAGQRQQNRLIALFNNWDMYKDALQTSQEAEGTAYEQNLIRMDAISYKAQQLKADMESLWMQIINSDEIKGFIGFLDTAVNLAGKLVNTFGGVLPLLVGIAAVSAKIFQGKITAFSSDKFNAFTSWQKGLKDKGTEKKPEDQLDEYRIKKYLSVQNQEKYQDYQNEIRARQSNIEFIKKQRTTQENVKLAALDAAKAEIGSIEKTKTALKSKIQLYKEAYVIVEKASKEKYAADAQTIIANELTDEHRAALQPSLDKYNASPKKKGTDLGVLSQIQAFVHNNDVEEILDTDTEYVKDLSKAESKELELQKERTKAQLAYDAAVAKGQPPRDKKRLSEEHAIGETRKEIEALNEKAKAQERMSKIVGRTISATIAFTGVLASLGNYLDGDKGVTAKFQLLTGSIASVGTAMLMTGEPQLMIIGGLLTLGSTIAEVTIQNTGFNKVLKDNKNLVKDTTDEITNARNKLKGYNEILEDYNKLQDLTNNGQLNIGDFNEKDLATYYDLSGKIADQAPELVAYYDDQGKAVINLTTNLENLKNVQREQIRLANETKAANILGFATEYSKTLDDNNEKIKKNQEILKAMSKGQQELAAYNINHGTTYKMSDAGTLTGEISKVQADLSDLSTSINENIVNPVLNSSKAFAQLSDKQKTMITNLLSVEKVTKLIADPEGLKNYTATVTKTMDLLLEDTDKATEKIAENNKEIFELQQNGGAETNKDKIQKLKEENVELNTQLNTVKGLSKEFQDLDKFKQSMIFNSIADLKLENNEFKTAFRNMTDYYSKHDLISGGPLTSKKLRTIAGIGTAADSSSYDEQQKKLQEQLEKDQASQQAPKYNLNRQVEAGSATGMSFTKQDLNYAAKIKEDTDALNNLFAMKVKDAEQDKILEKQYWDNIDAMSQTIDGYNELVKVLDDALPEYNAISAAEDAITNGEGTVQEQIQKSIEALGDYAKAYPELQKAIEDYNKVQNGDTQKEVQEQVAKAYEDQQETVGRMYATMMKNDKDYYVTFKKNNEAKLLDNKKTLGIDAADYETYADYISALDKAVADGKGKNAKDASDNQKSASDDTTSNEQGNIVNQGKTWENYYSQLLNAEQRSALQRAAMLDAWANGVRVMLNSVKQAWINFWTWLDDENKSFLEAGGGMVGDKAGEAVVKQALDNYKGYQSTLKIDNDVITSAQEEAKANIERDINKADEFMKGVNYGAGKLDIKVPTAKNNTSNSNTPSNINDGSSKDKDKNEVEDLDFKNDALHDTNVLLEEQENILSKLKDEEDLLYGQAKLDNMNKQLDTLKAKKDILEQQEKIINDDGEKQKKALAAQGVLFNANGTISNYNQIIESKTNWANSLSGDSKKDAIDVVKNMTSAMKEYEDFILKTRFEKEQAIEQIDKDIESLLIEKTEYVIDLRIDMTKSKEDFDDFVIGMNNKFETLSDNYSLIMDKISSNLKDIENIEVTIETIQNDQTMTQGDRIEALKKYQGELQIALNNVEKYKKEIQELKENILKKGLDLLDEHIDKFKHINEQLDDMTSIMKLIGEGKNYEQLGEIYEVQEKNNKDQLNALIKTRKEMVKYIAQLQEGSDEWKSANEQLSNMDNKISELTQTTLKLLQTELTNSVSSIMEQLGEALFGKDGYDEVKRQWDALKDSQEKYLSTQEKIVSLGQLQAKVQTAIAESTSSSDQAAYQSFLDTELQSLKEKDVLTQYDVSRAEKLYEITQKQIALENAQNNKSKERLMRDSSGNWSYMFAADTTAVKAAQQDLSNAMDSLMEEDEKNLQENQEAILEAKENFNKRVQEIIDAGLNGEYDSQEDMNAALLQAQKEFNKNMYKLQSDNQTATEYVSKSTMAAVLNTYSTADSKLGLLSKTQENLLKSLGDMVSNGNVSVSDIVSDLNSNNVEDFKSKFSKDVGSDAELLFKQLKVVYGNISSSWDNSVTRMVSSNNHYKSDSKEAIQAVQDAWDEYQKKLATVEQQTDTSVSDMANKVDDLSEATDYLARTTDDVISKMRTEWQETENLIKYYQDLEKEYQNLATKAQSYINKLEKIIELQEEAGLSGGGSGSSNNKNNNDNSNSDKNGWYLEGGNWSYYSNGTKQRSGTVNDSHGAAIIEDGVWTGKYWWDHNALTLSELKAARGYDTGGYTGDWGTSQGKLAVLHEKELVLKANDTQNILDAVSIMRDYSSLIKSVFGNVASMVTGKDKDNGTVQQEVKIEANFPGVTDSAEIKNAFNSLVNNAAQYALKK